MKDEYDELFDMSEYPQVCAALQSLPETALPEALCAEALFAKLDAQPAQAAPAPERASRKTIDISRLRRPIAWAAGLVLIVAAYFGMSRAGLLPINKFDAAPQAVSSAAATAAAQESTSLTEGSAEDNGILLDGYAGGAGAYDDAAPAEGYEDYAVGEANDAEAAAEAPAADTAPKEAPQAPMLMSMAPTADTVPQVLIDGGYTALASDTAPISDVLAERTGITEQALLAALSPSLPKDERAALEGMEVSSDGQSYALHITCSAPVYCEDCGGDIMTPYASLLYIMTPSGGGYDLLRNTGADNVFVAHISK